MPLSRRSLTQTLALGAGSVATLGFGGCATAPAGEPTLDQLARAKGLRFGSTLGSIGRNSRFHEFGSHGCVGAERPHARPYLGGRAVRRPAEFGAIGSAHQDRIARRRRTVDTGNTAAEDPRVAALQRPLTGRLQPKCCVCGTHAATVTEPCRWTSRRPTSWERGCSQHGRNVDRLAPQPATGEHGAGCVALAVSGQREIRGAAIADQPAVVLHLSLHQLVDLLTQRHVLVDAAFQRVQHAFHPFLHRRHPWGGV